jgi:hypothetical protein
LISPEIQYRIKNEINKILIDKGFKKVRINEKENYNYHTQYFFLTFLKSFNNSFVVEYALNYEDAIRNFYDDGELFPIEMGEQQVIDEIIKEIFYSLSIT